MATIPSTEPKSVTAGDSIKWTRSLADYPATAGWVLNYRLINAAGYIDIAGSASGADHLINVLPNVNPAWTRGLYDWQSYITNSGTGERYTIAVGRMEVRPNLSLQSAGYDARTQARQILDTLNTAYLDAAQKRAFVFEYRVANRLFRFATREEWIMEINFWKREVAREEQAQRVQNGMGSGRKIYMRF